MDEDSDDNNGFTFCNALREKYCPAKFEYDMNNITISPKKREVILQQQNHLNRVCLILDGCQIGNAGKDGEIHTTCPLVQELDLSNNILQDMIQVCLIANQLKHLKFINLSQNPLQHVDSFDSCFSDGSSYPNVEKLILNNTGIQLDVLWKMLDLFPRVNELHASMNQYGQVTPSEKKYILLHTLHFSKNDILYWKDVEHLGNCFPSLKTLIISENPFEVIPNHSKMEEHFPSLEKLSISKTMISDWDSLDQLRSIPNLTDIRFSHVPLLDTFDDEVVLRQLLIARLPNMKVMNGGTVNESEKEDAERAFIRYYKYLSEKPFRYDELIGVHGELADLAEVCMETPSHVVVNLKGDIETPCQLKLDLDQRTIDLRKQIGHMLNLNLSQFRLFYMSPILPVPEEMKSCAKRLYLYHFKDGEDIEIQRLDVQFDE